MKNKRFGSRQLLKDLSEITAVIKIETKLKRALMRMAMQRQAAGVLKMA